MSEGYSLVSGFVPKANLPLTAEICLMQRNDPELYRELLSLAMENFSASLEGIQGVDVDKAHMKVYMFFATCCSAYFTKFDRAPERAEDVRDIVTLGLHKEFTGISSGD